MSPHARKISDGIASTFDVFADQRWREIVRERVPRCLNVLVAIKRMFSRDAFAPAFHALGVNGNQDDATPRSTSETRFEKVNERHGNFTKCNCLDFQLVLKTFKLQA